MRRLVIFLIGIYFTLAAFAQEDPRPRVTVDLPNGRAAEIPPGPYTDS
ncbi:MAG: hypothetical protein LIO79_09980 [Rikenellaceae bacterium]|nr:hypothetical protein [Rikenellaceae bacterium]